VNILKQMGADFTIAVNVIPDVKERVGWAGEKGEKGFKQPNIFSVIMQSIYIASYTQVRSCLAVADIVVEPQLEHIGYGDFHRAQDCILQGELAAQSSVPEIKRQLEAKDFWLKSPPV